MNKNPSKEPNETTDEWINRLVAQEFKKEQQILDAYLVEIRDIFAFEAMKIMLSDSGGISVEKIATFSYEVADAMLKAREKNLS